MKIVYNKYIPFGNYLAINLFGVIFSKKKLSDILENHERIHTEQMKELWYIGFYLWYTVEWIVLLFKYKNTQSAYFHIRFEREAYSHQRDLNYINNRRKFNYLQWN